MKRNFIFIRHGQTPWGPNDIMKGPQNLSLNETGVYKLNKQVLLLKSIFMNNL